MKDAAVAIDDGVRACRPDVRGELVPPLGAGDQLRAVEPWVPRLEAAHFDSPAREGREVASADRGYGRISFDRDADGEPLGERDGRLACCAADVDHASVSRHERSEVIEQRRRIRRVRSVVPAGSSPNTRRCSRAMPHPTTSNSRRFVRTRVLKTACMPVGVADLHGSVPRRTGRALLRRAFGLLAPRRVPLVGRQTASRAVLRSGRARQEATANSCHHPGIPRSSCSPRSSKRRPEPATRSVTVRDTSTSPD